MPNHLSNQLKKKVKSRISITPIVANTEMREKQQMKRFKKAVGKLRY
jgi:hypothetical protein